MSQGSSVASGLVRVTIASGSRRVDLVLPGSIPVAELVPELARSVGLLDASTVYGGYRLVTQEGRILVNNAVLDALHRQTGVVGQDPALLGHQAVAAVDGRGVEQADRAGELRHELGDRDRARQHQIDPSRP